MSSHFKPVNLTDHARANRGEDVSDYCANCGNAYMAHNNGQCPGDGQRQPVQRVRPGGGNAGD